jgi:hypothetical protein
MPCSLSPKRAWGRGSFRARAPCAARCGMGSGKFRLARRALPSLQRQANALLPLPQARLGEREFSGSCTVHCPLRHGERQFPARALCVALAAAAGQCLAPSPPSALGGEGVFWLVHRAPSAAAWGTAISGSRAVRCPRCSGGPMPCSLSPKRAWGRGSFLARAPCAVRCGMGNGNFRLARRALPSLQRRAHALPPLPQARLGGEGRGEGEAFRLRPPARSARSPPESPRP